MENSLINSYQVYGPLVQSLKYVSWESWGIVLRNCSRRKWHNRYYKGRTHGTWWQLDDKLNIGSERNLYTCQEATLRTGHGTTDWFQIGKGVCQGCLLSPWLFNLYTKYIMRNTGLDETQTGIKIARRNINNLRYTDDTTLMEESKEELKSFLMKVKEESEKVGLKLSIQKTKIMASGPITSWQIDGKTMETVRDFGFGASKITADGDWSHKIKRCLLLGRKVMTNIDSILKRRDITLLTKAHLVKAMVFLVVMYGYESWTIKKAERRRIGAFELWCSKTLESPLDCKEIQPVHPKGNQSNAHWKNWCWSWNSNTLATWWEELTHLKRPWCWERLKVGREGDNRRWNRWWHHQLNEHEFA